MGRWLQPCPPAPGAVSAPSRPVPAPYQRPAGGLRPLPLGAERSRRGGVGAAPWAARAPRRLRRRGEPPRPATPPLPSPPKPTGRRTATCGSTGDMTPKAGGEAAPLNGNGSAEPPQEDSKGEPGAEDAIEPAPAAEGGDAKPEGAAAPKDTPKKKKKFSFKKSFKLSGISFRKNKKEAGDSSASSPTEDQGKAEAKGEEPPSGSGSGTEPSAPPQEGQAEERGNAGPSGAWGLLARGSRKPSPRGRMQKQGRARRRRSSSRGTPRGMQPNQRSPRKPRGLSPRLPRRRSRRKSRACLAST
uniref:MARCKS like 1 n=1 Tax=Anas platyrhynchos TaxID=8839 RepID=A0A8B9T6F1_ANAPL